MMMLFLTKEQIKNKKRVEFMGPSWRYFSSYVGFGRCLSMDINVVLDCLVIVGWQGPRADYGIVLILITVNRPTDISIYIQIGSS